MKREKLKVYKVYTTRNEGAFGFCEGADPTDIELEHETVCLKSDVDKFIAELKEKLHDVDNQWNEQCKEIAQLKAENESLKAKLESVQASAYADSVDAGMRERRLKRALWKARAEWARSSALSYHLIENHPDKDAAATYKRKANRWEKAKDKCLKKAEEYR